MGIRPLDHWDNKNNNKTISRSNREDRRPVPPRPHGPYDLYGSLYGTNNEDALASAASSRTSAEPRSDSRSIMSVSCRRLSARSAPSPTLRYRVMMRWSSGQSLILSLPLQQPSQSPHLDLRREPVPRDREARLVRRVRRGVFPVHWPVLAPPLTGDVRHDPVDDIEVDRPQGGPPQAPELERLEAGLFFGSVLGPSRPGGRMYSPPPP